MRWACAKLDLTKKLIEVVSEDMSSVIDLVSQQTSIDM